jgi:endonuclease/exonuclease/phosphatase family metal-dependent hydrolase
MTTTGNDEIQSDATRFSIPGFGLASMKVQAYDDPIGPVFTGQYAPAPPACPDQIVVVTYNIQSGKGFVEAGEAFLKLEQLQQADIILLQEMDESGVSHMAELLGYSYVYYPASVARDGRNVGNAILARWPLTDTRKVILPHRHPVNDQMRIAIRATLDLGKSNVHVYSVHTETYSTLSSHRRAQVAAIVAAIGLGDVIVGGDFNTVSGRSIQRMTDQFGAIGLQRDTAEVGPTISKLGIKATAADHIFSRGFTHLASGAVAEAGASDHFPVWVKLALTSVEEQP